MKYLTRKTLNFTPEYLEQPDRRHRWQIRTLARRYHLTERHAALVAQLAGINIEDGCRE